MPPRWAGARGNPVAPPSKRGRGAGQSGFPSSRRRACRPGGQGRGATRFLRLPSGAGAQGNLVSPLPGGGLAAPVGRGAGQPGCPTFQAGQGRRAIWFPLFQAEGLPPRRAGARGNPVSPSSKRGAGRPGGRGSGETRLPHLSSGAGAQGNLVSPLPGGGLVAPEGRGAGQPGFSVFQAGGWPPRRAGVWGNLVSPVFINSPYGCAVEEGVRRKPVSPIFTLEPYAWYHKGHGTLTPPRRRGRH